MGVAGGGGCWAGGGDGAGSCMMTWATRQHEVTDGVVVPVERSVCVGSGGKMVTGGTRWSVPVAYLDLVV